MRQQLNVVFQEYKLLIFSFIVGEAIFILLVYKMLPKVLLELSTYIILLNIIFFSYLPLIGYLRIKYDIEKNFPFFISFLYSIAFVTSSRKRFFEVASEATEFGYLSKIMRRILDLATRFKLGYAEAARYVQKIVPESSLKSFLDRFSSALEAGEELTEFLDREFKIALDVYETAYKKSLENIRLLQEMAVAFMSSLAFALVVIIIIPFLVGINLDKMMIYFVIIAVAVNLLVLALSKYFLVEDKLLHNLPEKPKEYQNLLSLFSIFTIISALLFLVLNKLNMPLLPKFAIAITPLAYVSYRTILFERDVKKKEDQFIALFDTLSGLSDVLGTSQLKVVDALRVHDFKDLNKHVENLYKRLLISFDYLKSWYYFACEIGSMLIARTILIFSRAIELGGDAKKIGEKLVDLFSKVLDLRKMKEQFLSNARGMFYGGFVTFVAILYVSLEILKLLNNLFKGISTLVGTNTISTIGLPLFSISIDIHFLRTFMDLLTIFQAFIVAMILKNIDGGSKLGIFIDFAVLLWISALISLGVNLFFTKFFFSVKLLPTK